MAKKAWKDLEGQFFRIDVGSTEAEALASEESNVIHITTERSIVMNGEVVGRGTVAGVKPGTGDSSGSGSSDDSYIRIMVTSPIFPTAGIFKYRSYITTNENGKTIPDSYGLVKINTSGVVVINDTFGEFASIDFSHWNPKNLTSMAGCFTNIPQVLKIDLSNIDVSKVKAMNSTFKSLTRLRSLNLDNWDTSNVVNFDSFITGCNSLEELSLMSFSLKSATSFSISNTSAERVYLGPSFFDAPNLESITLNFTKWTDATSIKMSLYNNLFPRKKESQPDLKLILSEGTKAVLTDTFKNRLTSYGYTLA